MSSYGCQNIPDDWNCYWRKCSFCGAKYHASEVSCDCIDNLKDCACGDNDWETYRPIMFCTEEQVRCSTCGSGPGDKEWVFEKPEEE